MTLLEHVIEQRNYLILIPKVRAAAVMAELIADLYRKSKCQQRVISVSKEMCSAKFGHRMLKMAHGAKH